MKTLHGIPVAKPIAGRLGGWRGLAASFAADSIRFLKSLHNRYGDLVLAGKHPQSCLFTFSSEITHDILSNPGLFYSYELESIPFPFTKSESIVRLTTALALMNGDKHKQQRRLMMPAFHQQRLAGYHSKIVRLVEDMIAKWSLGQRLDMFAEMDLLSIQFSLSVLIGIDSAEEARKFGGLFEATMSDLFSPAAFLFPYAIPGLPFHRLLNNAKILEADLRELIQSRKLIGTDVGDAMSLLIEAEDEDGTRLTHDELIGQTVALFRGGSKTTASALTWTLFFLDQFPSVALKLYEELESHLHGSAPSLEEIDKLTYLEWVIKESLRLMPPVIWGIRYSTREFEIAGNAFPKDQNVLYSAQISHRNPDTYEYPDMFIPERWETIRPTPYEYFPFSAGPRLCLGANFAMMAMKISLAMIFQRFHPGLQDGARIDRVGLIGSLPRRGLPMVLRTPGVIYQAGVVRGNIMNYYRFGDNGYAQ